MIAPDELAQWKRLCAAADPGPWEFSDYPDAMIRPHVVQVRDGGRSYTICVPVHSNPQTELNMRFVAITRDALPRLIAEVERLREAGKA